jgi:P27 family predicted phage terminase small subunit
VRPPDDLDRAGKRLYRETVRHLERLGVYRPTDELLVEVYVRALGRARELRAISDAEPVVRGSHKQPMVNPAGRMARQLELDAHRYAESLFLTPRSRARAGLPVGDDGGDEWRASTALLD